MLTGDRIKIVKSTKSQLGGVQTSHNTNTSLECPAFALYILPSFKLLLHRSSLLYRLHLPLKNLINSSLSLCDSVMLGHGLLLPFATLCQLLLQLLLCLRRGSKLPWLKSSVSTVKVRQINLENVWRGRGYRGGKSRAMEECPGTNWPSC